MNNNNPSLHLQKFPDDDFNFHQQQLNKIKPKRLKQIDIQNLINTNRIDELNQLLMDLSIEDFEYNDYFDLDKNELKLIKSYQILMQYLLYSINSLTRKNNELRELAIKNTEMNGEAEQELKKKKKKIKTQEQTLQQLTDNCISLEYIIKQLHLEDQLKDLEISSEELKKSKPKGSDEKD